MVQRNSEHYRLAYDKLSIAERTSYRYGYFIYLVIFLHYYRASLKTMGRCSKKVIKQLNRVSMPIRVGIRLSANLAI